MQSSEVSFGIVDEITITKHCIMFLPVCENVQTYAVFARMEAQSCYRHVVTEH